MANQERHKISKNRKVSNCLTTDADKRYLEKGRMSLYSIKWLLKWFNDIHIPTDILDHQDIRC